MLRASFIHQKFIHQKPKAGLTSIETSREYEDGRKEKKRRLLGQWEHFLL